MQEGVYKIWINNYALVGKSQGFTVELEYEGKLYTFEYTKPLQHKENVNVIEFTFSRAHGITIINSLPLDTTSKTICNISTNKWHKVTLVMMSPNYWNNKGIGNKHYVFMLEDYKSPDLVRGFFNEFLKTDLLQYKHVFEALGEKLRIDPEETQLGGLGFSSTKENNLKVKVKGTINQTLNIKF